MVARITRGLSAIIVLMLLYSLFDLPAGADAASAPVLRSGPADRPRIALTFDDNLYEQRALAVLDVLRRYDTPATVFVVGSYVNVHPRITSALLHGGFEVADHSLNHMNVAAVGGSLARREIGGGTAAYRSATGARTAPFFRPPYGATSSTVAQIAGEKGFLYQILWDVDTNDWRGYSAARIRDHVLRYARSGSIVLMHLSAPHTAEALPGIITGLRARGYELTTVAGLLKENRRFFDVSEGDEAGRAILQLVDVGILAGYNPDWFGPLDPMTRAQFTKVSVRTAGLHTAVVEPAVVNFVDVSAVRDSSGAILAYPYDYVQEAVASGLVQGSEDTAGRPVYRLGESITRLQLAQIVARMARNLKGYAPVAVVASNPPFVDVPEYGLVDTALVRQLGLMHGYTGDAFQPYVPARRAHVAMVMTRYRALADAPTTTTTLAPTTTTESPSTTTTLAPSTTTTQVPPTTTTTIATSLATTAF